MNTIIVRFLAIFGACAVWFASATGKLQDDQVLPVTMQLLILYAVAWK